MNTYNGLDAETLVRNNSHELTAHLLITERTDRLNESARHREELARMASTLADAQRIGMAVMRAKQQGRKTVRIDDVWSER